jgi:hypothetical protein
MSVTLYWTAGRHITQHRNFCKPRCRFQTEYNRESNIRKCTVTMKCLKSWPTTFFPSMEQHPPSGPGLPPHGGFIVTLKTHHTRKNSSGQVISPSQRPLHDDTQHSQETNIHPPIGFETTTPASEMPLTTSQPHTSFTRFLLQKTVTFRKDTMLTSCAYDLKY